MPRDVAKAHLQEGRSRAADGDLAGAIAAYRAAIAADPAFAVGHNALAVALGRTGDAVGSEASLRDAIRVNPKWPDPWVNLAQLRGKAGDRAGAADALLEAVRLGAGDKARVDLARVLRALGRRAEAAEALAGVAELPAEDALWLGLHFGARERYRSSIAPLLRATELLPERADAWYGLGVAYQRTHALDAAERAFRRCVALDPDHAEAWNNLGNVLKAQVRFEESVAAYREALRARPDKANTHRNLLFGLQYDPERTAADVFEAHRAYGQRFADPLPPVAIDRSPRKLRVGLVSADFGSHPVGYFLAPVLQHLDRAQFTVVAYAAPRPEDELTARLRGLVDLWVPVGDLDDDALAARIRADRIDVLFDLGGHTRGSRVQVFAKKPAPVQVTWAGYVGTTGLPTMDWLLADARHMPPGSERFAVERVWRMPRSYVCWEPPDAPEPGPLPMARAGAPTLGCMNNLPKLNRRVIALWSRILRERPDARLLLVTKSLGDAVLRDRWRGWFAEDGVDPARVEMSGRVPRDAVLRTYAERVDLALDPFPYAGGLTTLEALWMGVPVVTRGDGDRFASRHSVGHLGAAGLDGFVAADADDYVRLALRWLADPSGLAAVRAGLRAKVRASVLCDGPGFAREFGEAVRGMWEETTGARG